MRGRIALFAGIAVAVSAVAADYRIEPESFNDIKSWRKSLDANTSGKCQLNATTITKNVITEKFDLPESGKYYVWVRSFSYGAKARKFSLFVDHKNVGSFGDAPIPAGEKNPDLRWEKSKKVLDLKAGKFDVKIVPDSPYTRVDAVVLTSNADFVPPETREKCNLIPELPPPAMPAGELARKMYPLPAFKGKGEPVLVLSGGRPWTGVEFGDFLAETGIKVRTLDSRHLAGFGGSPIRDMLGDSFEPTPADYVTTEFASLASYKAVVVNNIPADKQNEMFTQERIAALDKYVSDGGSLLVTIGAPASLGKLLPVEQGKPGDKTLELSATRPDGKAFAFLPVKWRNFDAFNMVTAKGGATVLSYLVDGNGTKVAPYIVETKHGKGKVIFLNDTFARFGQVAMLYSWGYGRALMAALLGEVSSLPVDAVKLVRKEAAYPAPRNLGQISTTIGTPYMSMSDTEGAVKVSGNAATFADGARLEVDPKGAVSLTMPGADKPYAVGMQAPKPLLAVVQQKLSSATSEAVDMNQKTVSKIVWKFKSLEQDGKYALLNYESSNGAAMQWVFKSGKVLVDGRTYSGIAQKAKILKAPSQVSSLSVDFQLDIDATFARRMNCYQPPRGYVDMDFSGKVTSDTQRCNFFLNSQPFGYINTKDGIFAEIVEKPLPTEVRFRISKGSKRISANIGQIVGRRNAPVEGEFVWQLYSKGVENGHNDYIALWQFTRRQLRAAAGLKEMPMYPNAAYTNTATLSDIDKSIEIGGKIGLRLFHLPLCPSSIDSLDSDKNMDIYEKIRDCGMKAYPWSACDYTEGTGDWIFQNKKNWLMRDEKGGIYAYFTNHRVIDLGNEEFKAWYFEKLKSIFDAGVGYVYLDMGGQASTNVNFAGAESKPGLLNQIPIFKFFHDNGILCGVEGMDALVVDNYWYRENLYVPMAGKEFAMLGASIGTNEDSAFTLKYFRTAMYGAFPKFFLDAYAQQFERIPGELATIDHIAGLLPAINAALDYGVPFVRQTEYGTTWFNGNGGAVFVWDNVAELKLDLPAGFEIKKTQIPGKGICDFKADDLRNVASETIFLIGRK
ncbi:MAG: hypothetical protein MJ025_06530 [Victivallaceae bacterium]|nr:hypothetical protein [Victivallaceae bacterium]